MTDIPSAQARAGNSTTLTKREALRDRLGRDAFISLFLASNEFNEQIERACRAEGISHPQYVVLWVLCLADAREGLPMGASPTACSARVLMWVLSFTDRDMLEEGRSPDANIGRPMTWQSRSCPRP